ncbi:hypothetical protein [Vibrio nigripulchritudo]|uniref:hypothetical protein n=1 Tax=Vibrio nigripulchritudo TaxID=28173 RepID=UPI00249173F9|nr:hypothetical protein [Vibrio nigripulchritudo]BDU41051.1 hypothetical protein TUMSATVNIG2_55200 [Vibrio nigripulchritudo]
MAFPLLGIVSLIGDFFQGRREERQQHVEINRELHSKHLEGIRQGNISASDFDVLSVKTRGRKDEYLLILTTIPVLLSFIPDYAQYAYAGFEALEQVPDYYWYLLVGIYIDTFGRILRPVIETYLKNQFGGY